MDVTGEGVPEGGRGCRTMFREKSWVERVSEFGPIQMISDWSQFSFRKMSVRQLVSWECMVAEIVVVER